MNGEQLPDVSSEGDPSEESICILVDTCANEVATPDLNSDSCYGEMKPLTTRPDATALITSVWGKLGGPAWIPTPPPPRPSESPTGQDQPAFPVS